MMMKEGSDVACLASQGVENSNSVVASFKAPCEHELALEQSQFNTHVGRLQVTLEHTIGVLKGRFPWLRSMPMIITDNEKTLHKILKVIDCCVILQNLLLEMKDETPKEWITDENDLADDALAAPITEEMVKDERRQRLLECLRDFVF